MVLESRLRLRKDPLRPETTAEYGRDVGQYGPAIVRLWWRGQHKRGQQGRTVRGLGPSCVIQPLDPHLFEDINDKHKFVLDKLTTL